MKLILALCSVLIMSFFIVEKQPLKAVADKNKSVINYYMSHPAHDWSGTSKEINSTIEYNSSTHQIIKVTVSAPVASFDSQNKSRDKNMKELTEENLYPSVNFESEQITYTGNTLSVSGKMSFHGISKKISFQVTDKEYENHKKVVGGFTLQLEDFKVKRPSMMMVKSSNDLKIDFNMEYDLQ